MSHTTIGPAPPTSPQPPAADDGLRLPWLLAFCAVFVVGGMLGLGLAPLAMLRLEREPAELRLAVLLFLATGLLANLCTAWWLAGRGRMPAARLNAVGWASGILAAAAVLALGIRTPVDVATLAVVVGLALGVTLPTTIATVMAVGPPAKLPTLSAGAAAAALAAIVVQDLFTFRPESVLGISALVLAITGWLAWSRQHDTVPAPQDDAPPPDPFIRSWSLVRGVVGLGAFTYAWLAVQTPPDGPSVPAAWAGAVMTVAAAAWAAWTARRPGAVWRTAAVALAALAALHALTSAGGGAVASGVAQAGLRGIALGAGTAVCISAWPRFVTPAAGGRLALLVGVILWIAAPAGAGIAILMRRASPALVSGIACGLGLAGCAFAAYAARSKGHAV